MLKQQKNIISTIFVSVFLVLVTIWTVIHGFLLRFAGYNSGILRNELFFVTRYLHGQVSPAEKSVTIATAVIYILFFIGLALLFKFLYRRYNEQQLSINNRFASKIGTARWGTAKELNKLLGNDGIYLGVHDKKQIRLSEKSSCEHILVVGPTGCGKTTSFILPNLLDPPDNCSFVVTDPKGEIMQITGDYLISQGWNIVCFNPSHPEHSNIYNPLAICRSDTEVAEVAEIILKNGYSASGEASDSQWVTFAQPLMEFALLCEIAIAEHENRLPTIQNALRITIYPEDKRKELAGYIGGAALRKYLIYAQSLESPETASSIRTVLSASTKLFERPDIQTVTGGEGTIFLPAQLRREKTVLFIQIPEHKSALMKPIAATLYWQLMEHLIEEKGLQIFFLMDEFANIGKIPSFAQLAATVRSRKISFCAALQGLEQLSREYSKEEQQDIINNLKTKIFYPGCTGESGTLLSQMIGNSTIKTKPGLAHNPWDISGYQKQELLSADELRRIEDGKIAVLAHNLHPVLLDAEPFFKNKRMSNRARSA